jgi:hypothetical protein
VPLQYVSEISDELLKTYSGSDYITAKTVFLVNRSKDCRKIIDDLTRQFEQTLTLNAQIVLHKVNTNHQIANEAFKENILLFKETLENQIFKNNIPKYAKELILAQVAVSQLQEWGPRKWRRFFTKHARPESIIQDIDAYFNDAVNARVDLLQPFFISNLKADSE